MGWTFSHRAKGQSDLDYFKSSGTFTWSDPECSDYRVIDSATVNRTVLYAVLEMNASRKPDLIPDENGKVRIALVMLIKWVPKDWYNFGWKDMDEFMGPCESTCPEKILKQLSPFKPEALADALAKREAALAAGKESWQVYSGILSAHEWRERCRKRLDTRKAMTVGAEFRLPRPVRFTDGVETDRVTLAARVGRKLSWRRPDGVRVALSQRVINELAVA